MSPYKYLNSGSPTFMMAPAEEMVYDFQSWLTEDFDYASTTYTIQEEATFGSNIYTDIVARVNRGIQSSTGLKLGDDFKTLLFKDLSYSPTLGKKYYFDSNYWIVTFSETIKNLAVSALVRRCNNTLRWLDENGNYYSEVCAIDYLLSRPRDEIGTVNPVIPAGYTTILCQQNDRTKTIKGSQRFLFGPANNRVCLKVFADGVKNFLNQSTSDDESSTLLELSVGGNFLNTTTDDLVNGIADRYLDYNQFTSGSMVGSLSILSTPATNQILESGSQIYTVNYYSGSSIHSGSFIFAVSGSNVPVSNYTMTTLTSNSFSLVNNEKWLDSPLSVICSGSSGSRILDIELKGKW
jgi:hypothetical protein